MHLKFELSAAATSGTVDQALTYEANSYGSNSFRFFYILKKFFQVIVTMELDEHSQSPSVCHGQPQVGLSE